MNRELAHRMSFSTRARGLALAGSALVVLTMLCVEFGEMTRSAWVSVLAPGPASPDQSMAAICGSMALCLTAWLLGALAFSLLAALGQSRSRVARATGYVARLVAPLILRNTVAAVLGVAIVAGPASAFASPSPLTSTSASASASAHDVGKGGVATQAIVAAAHPGRLVTADSSLSPAWIPVRDRPAPVDARAGIAVDPGLLPGWRPDRPARPSPLRATPADPGPVVTALRPNQAISDDEIVIRRGDTLWDIAARHLGTRASYGEIAREWPHWFTANRAVIGNDPDHLVPGERLRVPGTDRPANPQAHPVTSLRVIKGGTAQ